MSGERIAAYERALGIFNRAGQPWLQKMANYTMNAYPFLWGIPDYKGYKKQQFRELKVLFTSFMPHDDGNRFSEALDTKKAFSDVLLSLITPGRMNFQPTGIPKLLAAFSCAIQDNEYEINGHKFMGREKLTLLRDYWCVDHCTPSFQKLVDMDLLWKNIGAAVRTPRDMGESNTRPVDGPAYIFLQINEQMESVPSWTSWSGLWWEEISPLLDR